MKRAWLAAKIVWGILTGEVLNPVWRREIRIASEPPKVIPTTPRALETKYIVIPKIRFSDDDLREGRYYITGTQYARIEEQEHIIRTVEYKGTLAGLFVVMRQLKCGTYLVNKYTSEGKSVATFAFAIDDRDEDINYKRHT